MAGYSRQSVADIIANAVIKAAPVNAEYNAIRDAFSFSGGHRHDGSSNEGAHVPLIADLDGENKVVVDTVNNRISVYTEVSGTATEQLRIQDGAIVPVTDDDIDLGTTTLEFKNLYLDGIAKIDTLTVDENATVAGTLGVTGVTTATGGVVGNVTGDLTGNVTGDLTGDVTSSGTSTFTTVDTTGNTSIGGTLGVTGTSAFTGAMSAGSLTTTGNSTHATVDINGGAIDGTIIGASTPAASTFTTVTTTGQATLASADINGGTIDGTVIGGTTAQAVTGTTITANTGFTGALTGNVTGNVSGNLTGNVTGDVTGALTGNVAAASGTSTFNDVTVNGTLDVTGTTIANVTDPVNAQDAATKNYVDTAVADVVDAAPAALDTLNELAAALGDDASFSTTVTNSIATKLPLAGGTMSGAIAMGTSKITGMGEPTANQDAATKSYVDTADATKLNLSGGTMTGAIDMGANKVTSTYTPTDNVDLTTKTYVDGILGSATAAATSAANAATSETNAATSETNAGNSASAAAASYDSFDDRWLGAKASAPTVDNDGDALVTGAVYFNTTDDSLYVWTGSAWSAAVFDTNGALFAVNNLSDLASASTARTNLGLGTAATTASTDYATAAQGTLADSALQDITGESIENLSDVASMTPSDGQALVYGSGVWSAADMAGGIAYTRHTANVTMAANEGVIADTSGGAFTVTLPASPAVGDTVVIADGDDWATANLTVGRNGSTIEGDAADMTMDIGGAAVQFTYDGTTWQVYTQVGALAGLGTTRVNFVATAGQTDFSVTYSAGFIDVYLNGIKLIDGSDFTATNGTTIVLTAGATAGDTVDTVAYDVFSVADTYSVAGADATFVNVTGDTMTGDLVVTGNVGIGASSPSDLLDLSSSDPRIRLTNTGSGYCLVRTGGSDASLILDADAGNTGLGSDIIMRVDGSEKMRIDSSGSLLLGTTDTSQWNNTSGSGIVLSSTGRIESSVTNGDTMRLNRIGSNGGIVYFYKTGVNVGSIIVTSSSTSYNTSSDYRLKTDAQPMTGASARVQALKPVNFEWIVDGTRVDGFLAHEAQEVVPEAVTGEKDAMRDEEYEVTPAVLDDDDNVVTEAVMGTRSVPNHQGIDQSKLVPLLTAALQEALTKIEAMEARLVALETST